VLREFPKRNDGVGVTLKAIHDRVTEIAEKTEIRKKVSPHVLRHTYGTMIPRKGASPQYIRQTMGHADFECEHLLKVYWPATRRRSRQTDLLLYSNQYGLKRAVIRQIDTVAGERSNHYSVAM
jgi:site-specific recombinase XerD